MDLLVGRATASVVVDVRAIVMNVTCSHAASDSQ